MIDHGRFQQWCVYAEVSHAGTPSAETNPSITSQANSRLDAAGDISVVESREDQTMSSAVSDSGIDVYAAEPADASEDQQSVPEVLVTQDLDTEDRGPVQSSAPVEDNRPQAEGTSTGAGLSWFIPMDGVVPVPPPAPPEAALRPSVERQQSWEIDPLGTEDPLPERKFYGRHNFFLC